MTREDEDSRMLFLYNEFLLYIFKCKWNRENGHLFKKILTSFNSRTRNTYCNVRLKIMIMQFFLQIWKQQTSEVEALGNRSIKLQSIDGLCESRKFGKVKGNSILSCVQRKYFSYAIDKIVALKRNFSKALVILSWFLLLFCYFY